MGLSQKDFIAVLELVKSVGLARDPDEFLHSVLLGVMDLVP